MRIFCPYQIEPLSLRNSIGRAWMGTILSNSAMIFYSEPPNNDLQRIELPYRDGEIYVVPTTSETDISLKSNTIKGNTNQQILRNGKKEYETT